MESKRQSEMQKKKHKMKEAIQTHRSCACSCSCLQNMIGMKSETVKRGDIVWVRVEYPHKWNPALVLSLDDIGILVTFSFSQNDPASLHYSLESDVVPFEDAFPFLVTHHNYDAPQLQLPLQLMGRRLLSTLLCPCLTDHPRAQAQAQAKRAHEFDPVGLLAFVLDAAVSPSVEPTRMTQAVRFVAQIRAFRSCYSKKHKEMYKQTKNTGDNVNPLPNSSLGQKMYSVTQESVALEPKENGVKDIAIGAMKKKLNSSVSVWEGNSADLFKNKHLTISLALDPLYMVRESQIFARLSLLGFKNISDQGIVDICFENISTMSRTNISVTSNLMPNLKSCISKRKGSALGLCSRLLDKETIIYLNGKRRRLDNSASCHIFPQISGAQESERDVYILKHTSPRISDIKMLEPEGSIEEDHRASTCVYETSVNFTDEVQKVDSERSQHCKSFSNLVFGFHSGKGEVDASAAKVKGMLGPGSSVNQERLQMSCDRGTTPLKSKMSATTELSSGDCLVEGKDSYQGVASCSTFDSRVGQLSKTNASFSLKTLCMKFPKNFNLPSKEQLIKKFSVFGSVDSSRSRVYYSGGSAKVVFLEEADARAAQKYTKKKSLFGQANVRCWLNSFFSTEE